MTSIHDPVIAFFNTARSYQAAALCIQTQEEPLPCYLEDSPVRVLLALSIELYLKAYLLSADVTAADVREFGHKVGQACNRCKQLGLNLSDDDTTLISGIESTNIIIFDRYLETGTRSVPNDVRMQEVAETLFNQIGQLVAEHAGSRLIEEGVAPPPL